MEKELETIIQAAKSGSKVLKKYFGKNIEMDDKNSIFLATNGTKIHEQILKMLP